MTDRGSSLLRLVGVAAFATLVAAVARELRLPRAERTWHGQIMGVPYDLRPPTRSRLRASWWAPTDPRILTPRVLGVGWALNLGRVVARAKLRCLRDER